MPADADSKTFGGGAAEFLEENNGGFSATRLGYLLWVAGVLVVWAYQSVKTGALQTLPAEVVTVLGILMSGKVVQKFAENKADGQVAPDPALPGKGA